MERETLIAALAENGIRFLAGSGVKSAALDSAELMAELVSHPDPRLHSALTALFLLHPDWAGLVPGVAARLAGAPLVELQARYMAAVYLQRLWRTRLGLYLGNFETLPDLYSSMLGLPSPNERFGKSGLAALADWHTQHSVYPFNRLASYQKSIELLFGQMQAEAHEFATTG